jgi:hypothetical protein
MNQLHGFVQEYVSPEGALNSFGLLFTDDVRPYMAFGPRYGAAILPNQNFNRINYGPFVVLGVKPNANIERLNFRLRHELGHLGYEVNDNDTVVKARIILGAISTGAATEASGLVPLLSSELSPLKFGLASMAMAATACSVTLSSAKLYYRMQSRERDANHFARLH